METPKARFWNVWWTLTMIAAAFTAAMLVLELLGAFGDVGLVLSGLGLLLTVVFGFTASTRSSLIEFRAEVAPRLDRVDGRLGQLDAKLGQLDARLGQLDAGMAERLDRIVTILDARLPRTPA